MKTKIIFLISLLVFSIFLITTAYSDEPAIHDVSINVVLSGNGDADISEIWDVTVTSGTEWYLSLNNLKGMGIENLSVTDESGTPYTYIENWDIKQDIYQKANKCGIVDKGSSDYEICWGVGSFGRHQFTVSYTLSGLVKRYSDYSGFNHTFLSKGLSSPVDNATVTIRYPGHQLDDSTAKIWAFGYDGAVYFSGNTIVAYNSSRISTSEGIIIMAQFETGMFPSASSARGSFETVKNKALEGSDYNDAEKYTSPVIIILITAILLTVTVYAIIYVMLKLSLPDVFYKNEYGQSRKELKQTAPINNDIPIKEDISLTYGVLSFFSEALSPVSLINYYMLKWAREKAITETTEQERKKTVTYIVLNHHSYGQDKPERELYEMLSRASDNGRLSAKSIEKWSYKKYSEISEWYKDYHLKSRETLKKHNLIRKEDVKRSFVKGSIEVLGETGWQYAGQIYGFKKYLMSLYQGYHNDEISEELWDDYLVYADILNIYDQMEHWYDDHYTGSHPYGYYYISKSFRTSYKAGESHRSSGDGGSSSSGGGGGASGGGGGGSR